MSFQTIQRGMQSALIIGPKNKIIQGFLVGLERPKKAKNKKSVIYNLRAETGERVNVWGCASINGNLLTQDGSEIESAFLNKMVRLTYEGTKKIAGKRQPMKQVKTEIDLENTCKPGAKTFVLKNDAQLKAKK